MQIGIIDDEGWEPDEDFYVELCDAASNARLLGEDTRTRITILDDDKPGMLVFAEKKSLRHPATERECHVVVDRVQGSDGKLTVKYKTVKLGNGDQQAKPDIDYVPTEGTLEFQHQETQKVITVQILQHENPDDERNELFGVKLYDADPVAVKISKKDTCVVEIVTDSEKKKQAEALT